MLLLYLLVILSVLQALLFQAHVHVEDENDNPPMFEKSWYEGHVREDCKTECEVKLDHRIRAVDPDKGPNSEFTVMLQGDGSDTFTITPQGKIILKAPIDREIKDIYPLVLVARDKGMYYIEVCMYLMVLWKLEFISNWAFFYR